MRRIIHILLSLCLLCGLLAGTACAAGDTYDLDEAGLSVTIPDSLAAFTRDFSPDDPELTNFGLSEELLQSVFYDGNNYLLALDRRLAHEVLVSMVDNGADQATFDVLSDSIPADEIDSIVEQYETMGFQFLEQPRIHQHEQVNFLVLNCKYYADEIPLHCLMYITAYNGKSIGLTLRSYLGLVTEEQEALMQTMVDSVRFDDPDGDTDAPEDSSDAPAGQPETGSGSPLRIAVIVLIAAVLCVALVLVFLTIRRKKRSKS